MASVWRSNPDYSWRFPTGGLVGVYERGWDKVVGVRGGPPFPQAVERPEVMGFQLEEAQPESKEAAEKASTRSLTRR